MGKNHQGLANLYIPHKFMPLYLENRDAPVWEDGSQHWMEFDSEANPVDEEGNLIPLDMLDRYGYKRKKFTIMYGGRGGGKSETMALIAIVRRALVKPYIILCCRELMASIRDSMYQTIVEWIDNLGLSAHFDIVEHEIRCKVTGSKFIFKGLRSNIQEIRSLKGVGLCIIDEATSVSRDSIKYLVPTLRLDDSEFWISFNTGTREDFIYDRFVTNADDRCCVIKVNLTDNKLAPQVLIDEMEASRRLAEKTGDWDEFNNVWLGEPLQARDGNIFKVENVKILPAAPVCSLWVRAYDLASSAVSAKNPNPDFTVGLKLGVTADGQYVVADVLRIRETADVVERAIINTAAQDGVYVPISIAQDPGGAGKFQSQYLVKKLSGYIVHTSPETGNKATRAGPVSSQVNVGNLVLVAGDWNQAFLNELRSFNGEGKDHDDQVDALSRAFSYLQEQRGFQMVDIVGL